MKNDDSQRIIWCFSIGALRKFSRKKAVWLEIVAGHWYVVFRRHPGTQRGLREIRLNRWLETAPVPVLSPRARIMIDGIRREIERGGV
jgi:hypothetical protein